MHNWKSFLVKKICNKRVSKDEKEYNEAINKIKHTNLNIKTVTGKHFSIDVYSTSTIGDVKAMIEEKKKIPKDQQHLYYNNDELDDFLTVKDYTNLKKETFFLAVIKVESMHILIESNDSRKFYLGVEPGYTINDVKSKIEYQEKIPKNQQELFYISKQLENFLTLKHYSIINSSIIYLKIIQSPSLIIFIKTLEDDYFKFEVEPKFTIHYLKELIQQKTGMLIHQQNLVFNGIALDNLQTIEESSIKNHSIVNLIPNKCQKILIQIQSGKSELFILKISPTSTIKKFKKMIEIKTGILPDYQKIVFDSNELDDEEKVLQYYSIQNKSLLNLSVVENILDFNPAMDMSMFIY